MREVTITIEGKVPTWNDLYRSKHWSERSRLAKEWHLRVRAGLTGEEEMFDKPVNVIVCAYYVGDVIDSDNVMTKLLIDGLKGKLLPEDNPRWVHWVESRSFAGERNYATITLKEDDDGD